MGRIHIRSLIIIIVLILIYQYISFKYGVNRNLKYSPYYVHVHHTFNFSSLQYELNSNICLYKKPKIIILVTSHVDHAEARDIIRKTHPKDLFQTFDVQIVFLLAISKSSEESRLQRVRDEFRQFNDVVQGNFYEDYRNLTYKHIMGLKWTREFCRSVKYVVKMDDDIIVNYYKLLEIVKKHKSKFQLMGHVIDNMRTIRNGSNKWYVSYEEYKKETYPTFLSGWLYIATSKAVGRLLAHTYSPYFWIDDVYVTGILSKAAHIKLTDIRKYYTYEPKNVECCISNKYTCDFLAAPSGGDYALNSKFSDYLWECRYKKQCVMQSNEKVSCLSVSRNIFLKGQLLSFEKV